jgi:hypothetical protein
MKKLLLSLFALFVFNVSRSQLVIDTLAMQNFDSAAYNPNWTFAGPVVYNTMGMTTSTMAPTNSPTGISGSRSWESTTQSAGLVLTFDTIAIPPGYDSLRVRFNLAAMNLTGTSGGPDNLDYVLVAVSFNNGPYYNRLRIRGATTDNSFWPFSATEKGKVYYQPQTEMVFANTSSGLQPAGYAMGEIVFTGSVSSVSIRMTGRSSSSSDSWLADNVILTGEKLATGINTVTKHNSPRIYPNPANDLIHIDRAASETSVLQVYNSLGTIVLSKELTKTNESITISSLANGIYFLKFDGVTKKIIKQ